MKKQAADAAETVGADAAAAADRIGAAGGGDTANAADAATRRRHGPSRQAMVGRTITLLALLPLAGRLPLHARVIAGLIGDPRVPASRKAMLAAAVAYAVSPIDVVPDRFPVLGMLDDVIVAALAVDTFLAGVPADVLAERLGAAGMPQAEFDEDVLRVRRLVPRPLRRIAHRLPAALDLAARVASDVGLRAPLGNLLDKEGSPA